MTLQELAEAMEEAGKRLMDGPFYDRYWGAHLLQDAKSLRQLAGTDRHRNNVGVRR